MNQETEQPIIPPYYLLIVALIGLIVAIAVLFTQPTFSVVGWGGLGIMLLSLVAWIFMAPDQARAVITGRTVRFGGTSLIITVVFVLALIALYTVVRAQSWQVDLTQRDEFSLSTEGRAAIAALGGDPTLPDMKITAFYDASMAQDRDRDELLFKDYAQTSGGKISYEFVNPDQNPALAQTAKITRAGQIYVSRVTDPQSAALDTDTGELVSSFNQDDLTNAIIRVALSGHVNVYIVTVNNGLNNSNGLSTLETVLKNRLNWNVQEVSLSQLGASDSTIKLNDPSLDGEVMIIPGGDTPLLDSELAVVTNYLDNGGHVIIMAGGRTNQDKQDLAAAPKLNDYLWSHFGLRFNDDVVLDPTNSIQSPFIPVATDVNTSHPIGKDFQPRSGLIFALPHSIEINPTAPENVTTDYIVRSSESSYAKTDYAALVAGNLDKTEGDQDGPLNLIAAADNSETGAKVVLMGSTAPAEDLYTSGNNANLVTTVDAFVWATGFDINEFLTRSSVQSAQKPEDTPVSMDRQTAGTVNFITIVLLPFGILAVGLLVWWNNRETAH